MTEAILKYQLFNQKRQEQELQSKLSNHLKSIRMEKSFKKL